MTEVAALFSKCQAKCHPKLGNFFSEDNLFYMIYPVTLMYSTVLYYTCTLYKLYLRLYCTTTLLYSTVLYYYSTVQYNTVLLLYCTVQYCTVYYTVQCSTELYSVHYKVYSVQAVNFLIKWTTAAFSRVSFKFFLWHCKIFLYEKMFYGLVIL